MKRRTRAKPTRPAPREANRRCAERSRNHDWTLSGRRSSLLGLSPEYFGEGWEETKGEQGFKFPHPWREGREVGVPGRDGRSGRPPIRAGLLDGRGGVRPGLGAGRGRLARLG